MATVTALATGESAVAVNVGIVGIVKLVENVTV